MLLQAYYYLPSAGVTQWHKPINVPPPPPPPDAPPAAAVAAPSSVQATRRGATGLYRATCNGGSRRIGKCGAGLRRWCAL
jgi:hypothetical protein